MRFLPAYGSIHAMKCVLVSLLATIALSAGLASDRGVSPSSPWEMAVEMERWLVDGAGARFLPGMEDPARDGDSFVFVDETWPRAFQARIGDPVFLRVSSTTGCYDFEDADGSVFWTVVPRTTFCSLPWTGRRTTFYLTIRSISMESRISFPARGCFYPPTPPRTNRLFSPSRCRTRVFDSTCFPSQLVFERMAGPPSPVSLDSVVVDGNAFHDIGILFLESALPSLNGVTFLNLAENIEVKP